MTVKLKVTFRQLLKLLFFPGALQCVVLTKVKASPIQGTFQDDRGFTPDHTPMSAKKKVQLVCKYQFYLFRVDFMQVRI